MSDTRFGKRDPIEKVDELFCAQMPEGSDFVQHRVYRLISG